MTIPRLSMLAIAFLGLSACSSNSDSFLSTVHLTSMTEDNSVSVDGDDGIMKQINRRRPSKHFWDEGLSASEKAAYQGRPARRLDTEEEAELNLTRPSLSMAERMSTGL